MQKINTPITYRFFQNGKNDKVNSHLPTESSVSLTVNGEVWLTFMCTPSQLEALAIGFLYNEGIIHNFSEVADVRVCEHGDNVDVWLHHSAEKPERWTRTSGCGGGVTSTDPNVEFNVEARVAPEFVDPQNNLVLSAEQIPALLEMLNSDQTLYRKTGGVHTSVLTNGKKRILGAEDIGRHNTLDKLAGQMLINGNQPKASMILTTGRISSEMMQKAIRLGVSVVISRTSPSSISVELAKKQGITLIGYAKRHRFNLYTHPERVTFSESVEKI